MTLPDYLRSDEYGEIFLAGHRITLYHLINDFQIGRCDDDLAVAYPTASRALIDKVIAFYHDHQLEVESYMEETRLEIKRQASASAKGPSSADLQSRLLAKRQSESA